MRRTGAALSSVAAVTFVALLLVAYLFETPRDLTLYYQFGVVSPLLAGVFMVGVVAVFTLARYGYLSAAASTGIALGLGVVGFLVVLYWAIEGRVDVFLARGWAFPLQRWVLVAVAALVVLGAAVQAWQFRLGAN